MVTSGPADETRRQILIPLWNCYKFFIDYAIADGFVPSHDLRPAGCLLRPFSA